jgi:hypothetical protein
MKYLPFTYFFYPGGLSKYLEGVAPSKSRADGICGIAGVLFIDD